MTAALFRLSEGSLDGCSAGAVLELDGAEAHHAVVRRIRIDEQILLADGSGLVAESTVIEIGQGRLSARVDLIRDAGPQPPRLVLAQALAKNDRDEAAIEAATELGVDEVLAWQAGRSVVVWRGERGQRSLRKWGSVVAAAAKQARRSTVPQVEGPVTTARLVERISAADAAFVLHERAEQPLAATEIPAQGEVLLVVGPEGGISDEELGAFVEAGACPVVLGDTVLRSSSAGPAGLAVVLAATRWRRT
ncbi:16S rRNA (uracil1498-N3)-methyltransferase [Austwickia chelonae]|uniref:Ribosomal RNA small subunit methyltransferase E n=1 Tax=Austwickia chelonae NBRC 105200 TaxID=1184607 RepID=K6W6W5_9MICO|nr:16S rRNA (uracil(1498)-N(3))-methyltransferase [Austwickia chelonae]GAB77567.1 ribosomal RNA small subunit methyltransferase E [Austwickia chelonae NBRC 105200]SEW13073.1 16S rRNA (uracil1498-N3)-methyltransferase [Austwickia chelonae]